MNLTKTEKIIVLLISLFLLPALLINLGLLPLIEDESIRALVALEMKISGNYITPTLGGVHYFNKPPLFNWIILLFYEIAGSYSEFVVRMPSIIFLLVFAFTIFVATKNVLGKRYALINAFFFITCGRIIAYDSMLGLIDITYSWITYLMFNIIYIYYRNGRYGRLFIYVYLLTTIGFMLKGMPSIAFTGISLLVVFISNRDFKRLFSVYHFVGMGIFILLIGSYYYTYTTINPGAFSEAWGTLFSESSKRTVVEHSFMEGIRHFISFPFQLVYHFLPWTLLLILLFRKGAFGIVKSNPYLWHCSLIFVFNIIVYWVSPNVYPRYFFMLMPLVFTVFVFLYKQFKEQKNIGWIDYLEYTLLSAMIVLTLLHLMVPFLEKTRALPNSVLISAVFFTFLSFLIIFYLKRKEHRLLITILFLLVFRTEFNLIILKVRAIESRDVKCREDALKIGRELKNEKLYLFDMGNDDEFSDSKLTNYQTMFYITSITGKILDRGSDDKEAYYIVNDNSLKKRKYQKFYDLRIRHKNMTSRVVKFLDEQ